MFLLRIQILAKRVFGVEFPILALGNTWALLHCLAMDLEVVEALVADSVVVDLAAVAEALVAADLAVVTTMGGVFTLMESQTLEITLHARQR